MTGHFLHVTGVHGSALGGGADVDTPRRFRVAAYLLLSGFAFFAFGLLLTVFGVHGTTNTVFYLYGVAAMTFSVIIQLNALDAQRQGAGGGLVAIAAGPLSR